MRTTDTKDHLPLKFIVRALLMMGAGHVIESFVTRVLIRAQPHLLFGAFYWMALAASFALMVGGFILFCKDVAYAEDYAREQRQTETGVDMAVLKEHDRRRQKIRVRAGAFYLAGHLTLASILRVYQKDDGWFFWSVATMGLTFYVVSVILAIPLFRELVEHNKQEWNKWDEWKRREKAELDAANAFIYGTEEKKD